MSAVWVLALVASSTVGQTWGELPSWWPVLDALGRALDDCWGRAVLVRAEDGLDWASAVRLCLKARAFKSLDLVLRQDVIPLADGMELVRFNSSAARLPRVVRPERILKKDLQDLVVDRVSEVLDTYVLRFKGLSQDEVFLQKDQPGADVRESGKGRIRRWHYRHMFPLMVVGFMTMASFLVPLGFQFMAMLGGKALLLSKMALIMSTFQGIKKVTSAGFNYGFYHVPPAVDVYHSHAAHHPEVWRKSTVVPEVGKSYSPRVDNRLRAQPEDEAGVAQMQAYQHLVALLATKEAAPGGSGGGGGGDSYQGSVGQPLSVSGDQHVLAVIPYLQNTSK